MIRPGYINYFLPCHKPKEYNKRNTAAEDVRKYQRFFKLCKSMLEKKLDDALIATENLDKFIQPISDLRVQVNID